MSNAVIDEDDYLQMAYEVAFDAQLNSIEKGEPEKFKRYFWNTLKREVIDFNRRNGYEDIVYSDDIKNDNNEIDDVLLITIYQEIDQSELDRMIEEALIVMTPRQREIWQIIINSGYSSAYEVAKQTGISRQAVDKLITNGIERVRTANLTVTDM
jgi:RNA polymerase sigma factor (sigma-70 family)